MRKIQKCPSSPISYTTDFVKENVEKTILLTNLPQRVFERNVFVYVYQGKGTTVNLLTLLSLGLLVLVLSAVLKAVSGKISKTKIMDSEDFVMVT